MAEYNNHRLDIQILDGWPVPSPSRAGSVAAARGVPWERPW